MPSPIGHALAGVAAAWIADLVPGNRAWRTAPQSATWYRRAGNGLTVVCAGLAAAPDADLVVLPFFEGHRTFTHSLAAMTAVGVIAAFAATRMRLPVARVALMSAAAYGTHLLLDWLGTDNYAPRGLQLFWPFDDRWFISEWNIFLQTRRYDLLSPPIIRQNLMAIATEITMLAPIVFVIWLLRSRSLKSDSSPTRVGLKSDS
jgi:membrane-bound metal-dependent hydrolase YbcI (DUF457 family)